MKGASGNWIFVSIAAIALVGRPAAASDPPQAPASPPPSCQTSHECAAREGYGSVCRDGHCLDYIDESDLLNLLHLKSKQKPPPTPFKLYPATLPAIGYNPALGFLLGTTLMSEGNEWELHGDWRFLLYNQDTYELGTAVPPLSSGVSKESRTNIRLDFGYGVDGLAIYLGAGEVF